MEKANIIKMLNEVGIPQDSWQACDDVKFFHLTYDGVINTDRRTLRFYFDNTSEMLYIKHGYSAPAGGVLALKTEWNIVNKTLIVRLKTPYKHNTLKIGDLLCSGNFKNESTTSWRNSVTTISVSTDALTLTIGLSIASAPSINDDIFVYENITNTADRFFSFPRRFCYCPQVYTAIPDGYKDNANIGWYQDVYDYATITGLKKFTASPDWQSNSGNAVV